MYERRIQGTLAAAGILTGAVGTDGAIQGQVTGGGSGGVSYAIGSGLKLEGGVLSVDAASAVEEDNTKPVTSAAVYTELGNVEALLENI